MGWKADVQAIVERNWGVGVSFTLADVYRHEGALRERHPQNHHVQAKLRQVLQQLRDDGIVRFDDNNGTYTRIR